jgi:putative transcription factor
LELDEDYSEIIKDGRAKANMSQEELARIVKEKLSMIQKIESGKVIPNMKLAKAIEHVLRVKLLVPPSEIPVPASRQKPTPEATLADIVKIKAKDKDAIPI